MRQPRLPPSAREEARDASNLGHHMTDELRARDQAACNDRTTEFAAGPEAVVNGVIGKIRFGEEFDPGDHAQDAAEASEDAESEDGGDAPFLAAGHLEPEDARDGDDEDDDVGGGVEGRGDDEGGDGTAAFAW